MPLSPAEPGPKRAPARATVGSQCPSAPAEYRSCQELCTVDICPNSAVCANANANSEGCPYGFAFDNEACWNFDFDQSSPPSRTRVAPNSFEWTKFEDICCYDQQLLPKEKNAPATNSAKRRCSIACPNIEKEQSQDPVEHSEQQQKNIINKANFVDKTDNGASHPLKVKSAKPLCCTSGSVLRSGPHMHRGSTPLETLTSQDDSIEKPSLITVERKPHDQVKQSAPPCAVSGRLGKTTLEADGSSSCPHAKGARFSTSETQDAEGVLFPPRAARAPCLCRMPPAFRTVCTGNLSGTCPCAKCNK